MQVTSATATSSASAATTNTAAASTAAAGATVDYNTFLKLLVAQLQHQDPTNPSDPTQYISQLASFSQVEQQVQTNSKLDTFNTTLNSLLTSSALSQADNVIGRTVTSTDGSISGKVVSVTIADGGALTATLSDGKTLALASGVSVS
jgi:flagellar basal-body rod modification protein FlgD